MNYYLGLKKFFSLLKKKHSVFSLKSLFNVNDQRSNLLDIKENSLFSNSRLILIQTAENYYQFYLKFLDLKKKSYKYLKDSRTLYKNFFFSKNITYSGFYSHYYKKLGLLNKFSFFLENFCVLNILLRSKFIFNRADYCFFVEKKFIFMNRKLLVNADDALVGNTILELTLFKFYFIYMNKINHFNFFFFFDKNDAVFSKSSNNLVKLRPSVLIYRLVSNNASKFNRHLYLEYDYVTMTVFYLNSFTFFFNLDFKSRFFLNFFFFILYL